MFVNRTGRCCIVKLLPASQSIALTPRGDGWSCLKRCSEGVSRLRGGSERGRKHVADGKRLGAAAWGRAGGGGGADGGSSEATECLAGKRHQRELREEMRGLAEDCGEEAHARLSEAAADARVNPVQRPEAHGRGSEMILNAVYLVEAGAGDDLSAAVGALRSGSAPL